MFELRDYQLDTINGIYNSLKNGNKCIVVQSPPRTGKTVIMSEIARRATDKNNRVLFMVHRKEIIDQAKKTFEKQNVNLSLADFGMVQTLTRNIEKIKEPQVIFVDEGHHALAKTYQRILDAFPNAVKLLFTATPERTSKKQLDSIATDIVLGKQISELIESGNLAPFKYYSVGDFDRTKLKKSSTGDFTTKSIDQEFSKNIYGDVLFHYKKLAKGKQAVVYCYSVENAIETAKMFNDAGISAVEVDGSTDKEERNKIINDFRNGKIQVMTNVELFTEGLDLPNVDCVIMTRPTASLSLYLQFSMRCLNPRENKQAIIIDHVGNWKQFGLPSAERDWQESMITKEKSKKSKKQDANNNVIQCENCLEVFYAKDVKDNKCPNCEEMLQVKREIKTIEDELIEIDEEQVSLRQRIVKQMIEDNVALNVAGKSVNELNSQEELKAYAKLHNYKPGWVYYQMKQKGIIK